MKFKSYILLSKKIIILFTLGALILLSCNKEDYNAFLVKTTSVKMLGEDTVQVAGVVTNSGGYDMAYTGFCISTNPVPKMMDNQVLLNGVIGKFSANYLNLTPNTVYYFRSFAANEIAYAYGNIIEFKVPYPEPPVVPCTLADHIIVDNGATYYSTYADSTGTPGFGGTYKVTVDCSFTANRMYYLEFMQTPRNGIYTTTNATAFPFDKKNVLMYINTGFNNYYINPNGKVYVSIDSVTKVKSISFCDLTYTTSSSTLPLKGEVTLY